MKVSLVRPYKILLLILLIAFFLSIAHSFYFKIQPHVDARAYDAIALNLVRGNGYVEDTNISIEEDFAITRVGPGYEFFLAGVYFLFGHHYEAVWFFQAIFHALSAFLVFLIAKRVFKKNWHPLVGLVAASFVAFSPDLIVASSMLLAESLGIFLILISVYFFFRHLEKNDWPSFFLFVSFFSFAALVRSPFAALSLVFIAVFINRRQWQKMVLFLFLTILIFSPWVTRNYIVYHQFIPFNSAMGYNLWVGNHLGASGELEYFQPLVDYFALHNPVDVNNFGTQKFSEFVFSSPLEFVKITLKRISIYFSLARPTGFWPFFSPFQQVATATFSGIYSVLLFVLSFTGVYYVLKNKEYEQNKFIKILFWMTLFMPLTIIMIVVETRYRFLIYPFLSFFAGFAVFRLFKNRRVFCIMVVVFLALALNGIFDLLLNKALFVDRLKNLFL